MFNSDPLHAAARQSLLATTHYKTKEARFREHDELRYSLRAARASTRGWPNATWHVVTADVPAPGVDDGVDTNIASSASGAADVNTGSRRSEDSNQRRLGLVPQWLDIECAFYGCSEGDAQAPPIRLQHGMRSIYFLFYSVLSIVLFCSIFMFYVRAV